MQQKKKLKNLIDALKDEASVIKASFFLLRHPHRPSSSINLAVVRATSHDSSKSPSETDLAALLALGDGSRSTACACIEALMERLHRTSNPNVAMKSLFTLHILVIRGSLNLREQVAFCPYYGGRNFLNLSSFRDVSDSKMNDLSSWLRWYAGVVDQNIRVWRNLGYLLDIRSRSYRIDCKEGKISGRVIVDLAGELNVLVDFVEQICEFPESLHLQINDLVYEVVRLVSENYRLVQREILIRVEVVRERVVSLSQGELTQLIRTLIRYENCKRRLSLLFVNRGMNVALWDLIKQTKAKLVKKKELKEEKRLMMVEIRADSVESTRSWNPFVEPGQLLWMPSSDGSSGPPPLSQIVSTVG